MLWIALGVSCCGLLCVARALTPSASGTGTHTQLGLPPCAFLTLTSLPCPACGLTTAFAFMVRGELVAALHANAFGALLCVLVALAVPVCGGAALREISARQLLDRLRIERVVLVLAMLALANWIARVAFLLVA